MLAYQPNLGVGQSTSLLLGVAGTTNNAAEITFNYTGGSGSALNSIGIGLFGNENKLTLTPTSIATTLPVTTPSVSFSPSTIPFKYSEGTWTPQFKYIRSDANGGSQDPVSVITYSIQEGRYVRCGNQVTVYFNITFTSLGDDTYSTSTKFMGVGNFPFAFSTSSHDLEVNVPITSEIPNGFVGIQPAPLVPVFPAGRYCSLIEAGTTVPLYAQTLIGIPEGNWTSDGTTMMIRGPVQFTILVPTPYPYDADGQIYNFWMASTIITYPMVVAGSMTYFTDAA